MRNPGSVQQVLSEFGTLLDGVQGTVISDLMPFIIQVLSPLSIKRIVAQLTELTGAIDFGSEVFCLCGIVAETLVNRCLFPSTFDQAQDIIKPLLAVKVGQGVDQPFFFVF